MIIMEHFVLSFRVCLLSALNYLISKEKGKSNFP